MILVVDGLLGLIRPVQEYVPEFRGAGKEAVLVHHLLTHTSGMCEEDVDSHVAKQQGAVVVPHLDQNQRRNRVDPQDSR